jgi:hypothetical protein
VEAKKMHGIDGGDDNDAMMMTATMMMMMTMMVTVMVMVTMASVAHIHLMYVDRRFCTAFANDALNARMYGVVCMYVCVRVCDAKEAFFILNVPQTKDRKSSGMGWCLCLCLSGIGIGFF